MKITRISPARFSRWLVVMAGLALANLANAQTTNWVAYNDHRPYTTPLTPPSWGFTAPNATIYDMGAPADTPASPLTDFRTGNSLTASVAFTRTGSPDDFGALGRPLATNTPAGRLFYGICDLASDGVVGVDAVDGDIVTVTFSNLDPSKFYIFRGVGVRNGGYAARWSVATIAASSWSDAHINGATGPGVLTANNFPAANLTPGQAAWNSGGNAEGAVVGWDFISPAPDGTFTIVQAQYVGPTPGGGQATDASYGYAFGALMLAEIEIAAPAITANPTASTTVEQNRPFSLSVAATGAPLNYQWYKDETELAGATLSTYSVAQAQVGDSGAYYAVVYNVLGRQTSTVAQVTVFADTTGPTVDAIFSYPTVDASGVATLNQIIIEYNEPVTAASVSDPFGYSVSGVGNPSAVIITNSSTVVLVLSFPLAEDTDYSVTLSGATDGVGNIAGSSTAQFHSWVSGPGNSLTMESYPTDDPTLTVESLFTDPDYPNNPDRIDSLWAFDTRLVYPDDSRENYGARIRGVFIPPVSGDWRFFVRLPVFGVLYINPNGMDEAGKLEIVRQSTQNAPYNWDRLQSSGVSLRAGRAYYIEGVYKNVADADYFKVAARLGGTGTPTPVDSADTDAPDANSLTGAIIAYPLAPRDLGGALSIQQDLVDLTADENNPTTFSIQVNNPSGLPLQYQWFRDSTPILGATGPTYTIIPSIAGDNGATFSVQVAKVGSAVTSGTATLTVVPDTVGPRVIEVLASEADLTMVTVRFNEFINRAEAEDQFAYDLGGASVFFAVLGADDRTVTLTLGDPLVSGQAYQLQVSGVHDLADNLINPNPFVFPFTAGGDLPVLRITLSGGNALISWPESQTGFVLEEAAQFLDPVASTVWTTVAGAPTVVNGRNTLSVAVGAGNRVFRLRQ